MKGRVDWELLEKARDDIDFFFRMQPDVVCQTLFAVLELRKALEAANATPSSPVNAPKAPEKGLTPPNPRKPVVGQIWRSGGVFRYVDEILSDEYADTVVCLEFGEHLNHDIHEFYISEWWSWVKDAKLIYSPE